MMIWKDREGVSAWRRAAWFGVLMASVGGSGCAVQSGDGAATDAKDEPIAETSQAVSATGLSYLACPSSSPWSCTIDVGSSVGRTCFLAGIWGDLNGSGANNSAAWINRDYNGSEYYLHITQATAVANPIGVAVECVNHTVVNRHEDTWTSGSPRVALGGTNTAARRCFLTGVHNTSGYQAFSDTGGVFKDPRNGTWYLGGSIAGTTRLDSVCFDVQADYGAWSFGNGSGSQISGNLAYNPGGVACGITQLSGYYDLDANEGVWIGYQAGLGQWTWTFSNGKGASAQCFQ